MSSTNHAWSNSLLYQDGDSEGTPNPLFSEEQDEEDVVFNDPPANQRNLRRDAVGQTEGPQRNRILKRAGAAGSTISNAAVGAGHVGMSLATAIAPAIAPALATASIVVPPVGLVLQLGVTAIAARSAYKSEKHYKALLELWRNRKDIREHCHSVYPEQKDLCSRHHAIVADQVLPYVIRKKSRKVERKLVMAMPGIAIAGTVNTLAKRIYKKRKQTLGVHREKAAKWLAVHYMTCECELSRRFIAALYSGAELLSFEGLEYETLWKLLMDKMKSI